VQLLIYHQDYHVRYINEEYLLPKSIVQLTKKKINQIRNTFEEERRNVISVIAAAVRIRSSESLSKDSIDWSNFSGRGRTFKPRPIE